MIPVNLRKREKKEFQIGWIEGPVPEISEPGKVPPGMVQDKIIRGKIHPAHELIGILQDRDPLPPRDRGGQKTGDLNILFTGKQMRNGNGVAADKIWSVVTLVFFFQE